MSSEQMQHRRVTIHGAEKAKVTAPSCRGSESAITGIGRLPSHQFEAYWYLE
jgi:hypothetical protein